MFKIKNKFIGIIVVVLFLLSFFFPASFAFAEELLQVAVPANPYNNMAMQLNNKENKLNEREKSLQLLQAKLEKSYEKIFVLIAALFALIFLNFILDWLRKRRNAKSSLADISHIEHKFLN